MESLKKQSVKPARRRWSWSKAVLRIIAIAVILTLIPGIGPLSSAEVSADSSPQCVLSILYGYVDVRDAGSVNWEQAVDGMTLVAGQYIRTANKSWAKLTFFEGSIMTLEPNTTVEIRQVDKEEQSTIILLKQWIGRTWSRVVKMLGLGSRYEIQTPSANAVVRGTLFLTEVDPKENTTVQTREGLVSVSAQGVEVYVPVGKQTIVESGEAPSKPVKASISKLPEPAIPLTKTSKVQSNPQTDKPGQSNSQSLSNNQGQGNSPQPVSLQEQGNNSPDQGNKQSQGNNANQGSPPDNGNKQGNSPDQNGSQSNSSNQQNGNQGQGNSPSAPGGNQNLNGNQAQVNNSNQGGNQSQNNIPPDQSGKNQGNSSNQGISPGQNSSPPGQNGNQAQGNNPPDPGNKQSQGNPDPGSKSKAK